MTILDGKKTSEALKQEIAEGSKTTKKRPARKYLT